jgi:hypothetical protein
MDWFDKLGWILVALTLMMLLAQVVRYFVFI